jgi:RNA polymerase sigma-70 factor (ECF subfamily)
MAGDVTVQVVFANAGAHPDAADGAVLSFEVIYDAQFAFVWRTVRRLGVADEAVDDVVQEVFVVVHRRLGAGFENASVRSWVFSIVRRVVRNARRSLRRKPAHLGGAARAADDVAFLAAPSGSNPQDAALHAEALRTVYAILDGMPDDRREVFVLAELEQMSIHEVAQAVGANVNTVYSRLRAARADFDRAAARARARDEWRIR